MLSICEYSMRCLVLRTILFFNVFVKRGMIVVYQVIGCSVENLFLTIGRFQYSILHTYSPFGYRFGSVSNIDLTGDAPE